MEIKLSSLEGKIYAIGPMGKQDVTDDCIIAVLIRLLEGHNDNIAVTHKSDGKKYELKAVEKGSTKKEAIKNIPIGSIWQDKVSKEIIEVTSIREESYMGGCYQPYRCTKYTLVCYKYDRGTDQRELDIFLEKFEKQIGVGV